MLLGQKIKELRLENGVLQRQLASLLEIDTPMFSKIERGNRRAKRTQVVQIANYFNVDEKELLTLWVADKVLDAVHLYLGSSRYLRALWVCRLVHRYAELTFSDVYRHYPEYS